MYYMVVVMTISIRLDSETERQLRHRLADEGIRLSDFIREAIQEKLADQSKATTPYEIGKELFGRYASGDGERSLQRKSLVKQRVHEKHRR